MKDLLSPGSLVTVGGGVLTVVGGVAYATGSANLSLPTIFTGFRFCWAVLALKSSELPPARRVTPKTQLKAEREQAAPELGKLLGDVTRWRYGQKAHLESSLEALKLWDDDNPPSLTEIEELSSPEGYGLRLRFEGNAVPIDRWEEKLDRLGRFFAKGMRAELTAVDPTCFDLKLLPDA